jgi:GTP-binding protein LepA
MSNQEQIRNFCIIAHIDHGKSTLADRFLEITNTVAARDMKSQILDSMDLERERGITIKLQPVRMILEPNHTQALNTKSETLNNSQNLNPKIPNNLEFRNSNLEIVSSAQYQLNLIDTPGHVDFSYEVSRSLAAVEGAILLVDATQGIQAQTLSTVYMAIEAGLEIIPAVNKIDLPAAQVDRVIAEISELLGCSPESVSKISAKTGEGVEGLLKAVVAEVPPPKGEQSNNPRALVFDSYYDEYRGVILYVRMIDGSISSNAVINLMASGKTGEALEVGFLGPKKTPTKKIDCGEIGYIVTNFKSVSEARPGDTVTLAEKQAKEPLAGYRKVSPFVYAGFFPINNEQYQQLKESLAKLKLNDAALQYEPENSAALGFGFRIGFLGLLHLDIIKERLEREYGLDLIITTPSTDYQVVITNQETIIIRSAKELPDVSKINEIREPWVKGEIITPKANLGAVLQMIIEARGLQKHISYLDEQTAVFNFEAPLANILTDFHDRLKSITSGYGSFNYELAGYRAQHLVRLDILVAGEIVDSLSQVVHRKEAANRARQTVAKLKEAIPRQLFEVSLQGAIGGKIITREDIKPLGKNVTAKLYGGDVTRKRKLIEKQKSGKKRMKMLGKVEIPPEAFAVLLQK